jgi:hypothetical protein
VLVRVPSASAARCEVVVGMSVLDRVLASAQGEKLPASLDVKTLMAQKDLAFKVLKTLYGSQTADPYLKVRVFCIPEPVVSDCIPVWDLFDA